MAPLAVDPAALDSAGAAAISIGEDLGSTLSTLTSALAGSHGMAGDDPAGAAFGHSYDKSSAKLLEAMATTRNGLCRLGDGVRVSAHNYSVAEAHSNISGRTEALPSPQPTGAISAGSAPSSVGRGVGVPAGWGWVANYIGMIWPTGNSAKLRDAAAAWISAGTNFQVSEIVGAVGPMSIVGAQQIPEGPAIAAAFTETNRCAAGILQQCTTVATHLTSYASKLDTVHAAIIDLLSRICNPTTGIKEVWEFLTHEDEDEIKKIAHDIRIIVNQFTAEAEALGRQITTALTEAKTILSTMVHYAEKEWHQFLHATDVGRALDHVGRIFGGFVTEAESTLKGIWNFNPLRAVVDPKGFWQSVSGALEHIEELTGLNGEHKAEEAWKEEAKGLVHWDEWSTDPFTAAGETIFDVATALVPGGALSKVSKLGRLGADTAEAPKGFHVPTLGRAANPASHDNPPQRNDPPKAGQPGSAPPAKGALPPYGVTEPKAPAAQKSTPITEPKPIVESAQPSTGHESPHPSPAASLPTTPAGAPPGISGPAPSHPPTLSPNSGPTNGGGDDTPTHGLTDEKRDEILATPKGSRPDPSEYLSPEYIEQHLGKFSQGGTRFMPQENFDRYGIGQRDGTTFLFPTGEVDTLIGGGNLGDIETALGLPVGYFDNFDVVRVDVSDVQNYNVRIPSGNEAGAHEYWLPGGLLPGGMPEAVIDGSEVLPDDLIVADIEGVWRK